MIASRGVISTSSFTFKPRYFADPSHSPAGKGRATAELHGEVTVVRSDVLALVHNAAAPVAEL